jgi:hypothetical protein
MAFNRAFLPGRSSRSSNVWMCPKADCTSPRVRAGKPPKCPVHKISMVEAVGDPLSDRRAEIEAERAREENE